MLNAMSAFRNGAKIQGLNNEDAGTCCHFRVHGMLSTMNVHPTPNSDDGDDKSSASGVSQKWKKLYTLHRELSQRALFLQKRAECIAQHEQQILLKETELQQKETDLMEEQEQLRVILQEEELDRQQQELHQQKCSLDDEWKKLVAREHAIENQEKALVHAMSGDNYLSSSSKISNVVLQSADSRADYVAAEKDRHHVDEHNQVIQLADGTVAVLECYNGETADTQQQLLIQGMCSYDHVCLSSQMSNLALQSADSGADYVAAEKDRRCVNEHNQVIQSADGTVAVLEYYNGETADTQEQLLIQGACSYDHVLLSSEISNVMLQSADSGADYVAAEKDRHHVDEHNQVIQLADGTVAVLECYNGETADTQQQLLIQGMCSHDHVRLSNQTSNSVLQFADSRADYLVVDEDMHRGEHESQTQQLQLSEVGCHLCTSANRLLPRDTM